MIKIFGGNVDINTNIGKGLLIGIFLIFIIICLIDFCCIANVIKNIEPLLDKQRKKYDTNEKIISGKSECKVEVVNNLYSKIVGSIFNTKSDATLDKSEGVDGKDSSFAVSNSVENNDEQSSESIKAKDDTVENNYKS